MPLLEAAVRIHPGHVAALGLLAERALEAGDVARGLELLELQAAATREPDERALRFERVADAVLSELNDTTRASASYDQAVAAVGDAASVALLEKTLNLQRAGGKLERAAETAARLVDRDGTPAERAKRLREAAALDAALGRKDQARERLQKALELDPLDHETLAGLSAMLVQEGRDEDAAQLLTRALPLLPPATIGLARRARPCGCAWANAASGCAMRAARSWRSRRRWRPTRRGAPCARRCSSATATIRRTTSRCGRIA